MSQAYGVVRAYEVSVGLVGLMIDGRRMNAELRALGCWRWVLRFHYRFHSLKPYLG